MASMEHPNIAKLLDAGQTDLGRPYFVMELVQGIPISTYCDTHRFSIRSRVQLFITFCRAIHYAHEKGIIHQDLKPANVLVSQVGGVPAPKVIDFGIARVRSVDSLDFDRGPLIGTPRYLSPELLESTSAAADIRTDIFSLGSMLFELLTGMSAIAWEGQPIRTVQDIRETFANARWLSPSERLQQVAESGKKPAELAGIARNRGIGPATLIRAMHEDLDWVVSKAIHFDRSGRYDSVAALADDLQRYLDYRPVLAAQPAVWYQVRRFCARNKTVVASLLIVLILLVSSLVIVSAALVRVRAAELLKSKSEAEAIAHMGDSLLQQARSAQYSRVPGQRLQSLRVLEQAARIKPSINHSDLRNQAISSMSLIDAALIDVRKGLPDQINSAMAANADLYAVSDGTGLIQIYHRTGNTPVWAIPGNGFPIDNFVLFSRDGKYLAARYASGPCGLRVWDLTTRQVLYENISGVAFDFAGSGKQFAVGTSAGNLEIRDLPTNTLRKTITAHGRVQKIAFRPGDDRLSVWSAHDGLRIADLGAAGKSVAHTNGFR